MSSRPPTNPSPSTHSHSLHSLPLRPSPPLSPAALDKVLPDERVEHGVEALREVLDEDGLAPGDGGLQDVDGVPLVEAHHDQLFAVPRLDPLDALELCVGQRVEWLGVESYLLQDLLVTEVYLL